MNELDSRLTGVVNINTRTLCIGRYETSACRASDGYRQIVYGDAAAGNWFY